LLADYINKTETSEFLSIELAEEKEYYPCSLTQKRFYIMQNLDPGNISYNLPIMLDMEGHLEIDKLETVFKKLIKRHQGLRTSFALIDGEIVQRVHDEASVTTEFYEAPLEKVTQIFHDFVRPFNLDKVPLFRIALIKVAEDRHLLINDMHHIITDGLSSVLLSREFIALYEGKELTSPQLQYTDFSEWQNSKKEKQGIKEQGEYWLKQFEDQVPVLTMQTDYPRPTVWSFAGSVIKFDIAAEETKALNRLALQEEASLFMVLFSIYNIMLSKLTGQLDIIIGTGVLNRSHPDLMSIIGLFFNTLPLRCQIDEEKSFREFLTDVKEKNLEALANQDYPVDMLVEELLNRELLTRAPGRNPLFDTMFALQNYGVRTESVPETQLTGLTIKPYKFEKQTSRFDLFLEAAHSMDAIYMKLEYSTALFKPSTAEKITDNYLETLKQVVNDPDIKIEDICISSNLIEVEALADQGEYVNFGF
jgi:hypothetical protein